MNEINYLNNLDQLSALEEGDKITLKNEDDLLIGLERIFCLENDYIAVVAFGADIGKLYNFDYIRDSNILEDLKNEFGVVDFSIID